MFNKFIASILPYFPKKFIWIFSRAYISGVTMADAMRVSRELNALGIKVTLDVLGEFITSLDEAEANKQEYLDLIDETHKNGIDGNYSLKPTSFGLLLDKEECYRIMREIVAKAASYNNFCRIDMEDSPCTDLEIELYRRLHAEFPRNVGLVLQAYLKRTYSDLEKMLDMNTPEIPTNYRLCKGIYVEPAEISYKKYEEINKHYLEDLEFMFRNKIFVGIATHDKPLIEGAYELIKKYNVPKNMYEFQMLYGVTPKLRQSIVDAGHDMRVYVPFGEKWFSYSTRRLKENPKMASHIMKAIFVKG
ncbi:MAG TPA: proline dehydrogenase family protein [Bacteroidales bacterium]|jgi:proline dehydrogenase|nr:proline dehydrogenase family protein [Bacteroidales bacterium]MDI9534283.1 proline dehydrogenase family protein [Bacteroidota bacterium]MBK7732988.1 proline dehydrogenase family protein [Bacteroidales bacterium]MBP7035758.1 proline dehydrogenase family protein [Bacteroidales bacterium]MBP8709280.1 proline dehydrogenase family protein [Bacteroidales bacterium]